MKLNYENVPIKSIEKAEVSVDAGRKPQPCNKIYCANPAATHGWLHQEREMIVNGLSAFLHSLKWKKKLFLSSFFQVRTNKLKRKISSSNSIAVKHT